MKQSLIDFLYNQAYDVNDRVKYYLDKIGALEMSTYKPQRMIIPSFSNKTEQAKWEHEQIRRTRFGYNGICGMMYMYTYFWKMKSKNGGLISPEFRRCNAEFFNLIESCLYGGSDLYEDNTGKGVILGGRRRWGKSYSLANAMYCTAIHNPYSEIGFTSKTEEDMKKFMNDVLKTGYNNLPAFLRATSLAGNSASRLDLSKKVRDKDGNIKKVGLNSVIFGRSPEPTSFEGAGMRMVVYEEPGKWLPGQLKQNWSYTEPALAADDGITRKGVPILAGTAGDAAENGDDFKDFWYNAESYGLKRYFAAGWSGFMIEGDFGNENVIEGLKYILSEREKKKKQSMKRYYDFVVQYPLEPEEMFIQVGESPFDVELLNNRMGFLDTNPPLLKRGVFRKSNDKVVFIPKEDGDIIMREEPEDDVLYAAGCDPTDGAKKEGSGSDLSFFIAKGLSLDEETASQGAVLQYTAKPKDMNEAYEQCALALEYYSKKNPCTVLIERNRARMIAYFQDRELARFLAKKPPKIGKLARPGNSVEYGVYMDEMIQDQMIGILDDDISNNIEQYFFGDLLADLANYNPENRKRKYDRVDAWGLTLINLRTASKSRLLRKKTDDNLFAGLGYVTNKEGKLERK